MGLKHQSIYPKDLRKVGLSKSEASGLIVSVILRVEGNGVPVHMRPRLVGPECVAPTAHVGATP